MIKIGLLLLFCVTCSFAGIADDLAEDNMREQQIKKLVKLRDGMENKCCEFVYLRLDCSIDYDLKALSSIYELADVAMTNISDLRKIYKEQIAQFLDIEKNKPNFNKTLQLMADQRIIDISGEIEIIQPCRDHMSELKDMAEYKNKIKDTYKALLEQKSHR